MKLRFFIDRPVFSGVISVVIVLLGVVLSRLSRLVFREKDY